MEIKEFFEPVLNFIKGFQKKEKEPASKQAAKDRLKLVLMQDRASVSPDFFDMMKQEIIDVIKKYIEIDEESLEVELARGFETGLEGPALYANIPIKNVKPVAPKSEEHSALSEEEADKIADEILEHIESVAEDVAKEEASEEVVEQKAETLDEAKESKEEIVWEDEKLEEVSGGTPNEEESSPTQKTTVRKKRTTTTSGTSKKSTAAKKTTATRKKKTE